MKISIEVENIAAAQASMARFAQIKGKETQDVIDELAAECAKQAASRVQPLGLSVAKMKKFEKSIMTQVNRAIKNANVQGGSQSAEAAHKTRRNNKGQVPKRIKTDGQFHRDPISIEERFRLAELKAKNAGMAKGAWIEAGLRAFSGLKVAKYFLKKLGNGDAIKTGTGFKRQVTIHNKLSYISKLMTDNEIKLAIERGYRGMFGKIKRTLEK